jgi:GNAT superfamily N-acetyltransferase
VGGSGVGPRSGADEAVSIRPARPEEAERLREIARSAKGYWDYDQALVRDWAATLDFRPDAVPGRELFVAEVAGEPVGLASILTEESTFVLEDLWIDQPAMGRGLGRRLVEHAASRARELGATRLVWEAEPNAVGFYERLGAHRIGESEPGAWGRRLPLMALDLT